MKLPPRALATVLAAALLVPGCSMLPFHRNAEPEEQPDEEIMTQDIAVHVANHNWSNIVVFALRGSSRIRLGDVTTGSEADFVLPAGMAVSGQATLILHPIGGPRDFSTGPIQVGPGQMIELRVENSINQTSWIVS